MRFIVINANKNSGKTHTLNYLILKLLSDSYNILYSDKAIRELKQMKKLKSFALKIK